MHARMNSQFKSRSKTISTLVLGAALGLLPTAGWGVQAQTGDNASAPATSQSSSAKQDLKTAGKDTKDAAKSTGSGVKKGTKSAYHATKKGTTTAAKKVGSTTKGAVTGAKDGAKKPASSTPSTDSH